MPNDTYQRPCATDARIATKTQSRVRCIRFELTHDARTPRLQSARCSNSRESA